jgi:hypothetical protein
MIKNRRLKEKTKKKIFFFFFFFFFRLLDLINLFKIFILLIIYEILKENNIY